MHTARLRQVGGSVMLAIAPRFLEELDLGANAIVGVELIDGRLVVEPRPRPRYTLAELLAQCDPVAPEPDADPAFTATDDRIGGELI